jgi:hypothetical protein
MNNPSIDHEQVATAFAAMGKQFEQVLFMLARSLAEPREFLKITGAKTMLDPMYYGLIVCGFARDVYPLK